MSKETAIQFLKNYRNDEEAMKLLAQYPQPQSAEEAIPQLLETAGKLGIQITEEELAEAIQELKDEQKAKTDAATEDMQALDDSDLDDVAGGKLHYYDWDGVRQNRCHTDFTDENCKINDACWSVFTVYYDCTGKYFKEEEKYDCWLNELICKSRLI